MSAEVIHILIGTLIGALAIGGILFIVIGAVGMHRMPDVYTRIHAASIIDTGGATLIIASLCIYSLYIGEGMAFIKMLLTYFFIIITGPTASHAVAKMALMGKAIPIDKKRESVVHQDLLESNQSQYTETR